MQQVQLAASRAVQRVLCGRNLDQVLEEERQAAPDFSLQQRAALQDLSYGTMRHYGLLVGVLMQLLDKPLRDDRIRCLLLVALYQLQYGKSAQHAVVDHAVSAARFLNAATGGLVNAVLRNFLRRRVTLLEEAEKTTEGRYSHPQWWVDMLRQQYRERAESILLAGNGHPPMTLRVNRHLIEAEAYRTLLQQQGIVASFIEPGALLLERPVAVDKLPGFFDGLASVQDAGAQYAARLLDVRQGMRVLDACAAPGGKTAHILELADVDMVALDRDEQRLQRVSDNLRRLHLKAEVRCGDASQPEAWWDGKPFQRILVDAPCSASGVVRRHPDIKWLRRQDDIVGFSQQQARILASLWRLLGGGGKLLYVTCSVFEQENRQVIEEFISQHDDAMQLPLQVEGIEAGQLLPDEHHDGFFYALLQKR